MIKVQELEIKNKYTGELIGTIPADTPETVNAKIKNVHKNQYLLKEMDFLNELNFFLNLLLNCVLKNPN